MFNAKIKSPEAVKWSLFVPLMFGRIYERIKRTLNGNELDEEDRQISGWRSLPEIPRAFNCYFYISNLIMIYPFLLEVLPVDLIVQMFGGTKPAHCYFVGHFSFCLTITKGAGMAFSASHLAYRAFHYSKISQPLQLDLVSFIAQSDEQVAILSSRIADDQFDWEHYEQVRSIMCFEVRQVHSNRVTYKLRPHRTLEAKQRLANCIARIATFYIWLFLCLGTFLFSYFYYQLLTDWFYVSLYPGCSPAMDLLYANGSTLTSKWSITIIPERIPALLGDMMRTTIIWFDNGVAAMVVLPLAFILNYDLLLYWQVIDSKISSTLVQLKRLELEQLADLPYSRQNLRLIWRHKLIEQLKLAGRSLTREHHRKLFTIQSRPGKYRRSLLMDAQSAFDELGSLLCDFFLQVKLVDVLMSDLLFISIVVWFTSFIVFSYGAALKPTATDMEMIIVRVVQLFALVNFLSLCIYVLSLHRTTTKSYPKICSLIARIKGKKTKLRALKVLEFFTCFNRNTYSLVNGYPLKPTTFLTFIGWNISGAIVFEQYFGRSGRYSPAQVPM